MTAQQAAAGSGRFTAPARARRRARRRASAELDWRLADEYGEGRVYAPGEYYPAAAPRMLDAIDAEHVALERIRNFAAGVAWAVDRGDSLAEVRARIERAAAVVLGCALVPIDRRDTA
ncbi:hypothetical protein [Nocardia cyriacigeorgica]|uniref:hypothetical protein n=1 Tax=Nocardia cyriacigeorgica TaxID=135487 RepID=UPI00055A5FDD|nr:hypothetical protein [Nocardia cyriacigeorgica]TLF52024.1 hypothetical protein FEK31_28295 [Nocardia cyriacigeorgica]